MASNGVEDYDDEYYVPLVDQRVFGAGIKRNRIAFVPARSHDSTVERPVSPSDFGSRYLSIVLPNEKVAMSEVPGPSGLGQESHSQSNVDTKAGQEPLTQEGSASNPDNDTSIASQLSFEHSHPPSHLDRSRLGLKYLQEYGWDPDAREGLGSRREGIRVPVKANPKNDTAGLGLLFKDDETTITQAKKVKITSNSTSMPKLNAKQVRRIEEDKRKKGEKLRQSVYGEDWSRYLGSEV